MSPRRLIPVLLVLTAVSVALTAGVLGLRALKDPPAAHSEEAQQPSAASVLSDWDAARAQAWAAGDTEGLANLYVAGSKAGRADLELLQRYVDRGVTVEGLATQVLSLEVRQQGADELDLLVTDRLVGGEAVSGETRRSLPRDRPSTRVVIMRREGKRWLVAEVRDQLSAAASTSVTSSSRKS